MKIILNGKTQHVENSDLPSLIIELGYQDAHIGIALNGEFLPRSHHSTKTISDGDRIEILAPLQGG